MLSGMLRVDELRQEIGFTVEQEKALKEIRAESSETQVRIYRQASDKALQLLTLEQTRQLLPENRSRMAIRSSWPFSAYFRCAYGSIYTPAKSINLPRSSGPRTQNQGEATVGDRQAVRLA